MHSMVSWFTRHPHVSNIWNELISFIFSCKSMTFPVKWPAWQFWTSDVRKVKKAISHVQRDKWNLNIYVCEITEGRVNMTGHKFYKVTLPAPWIRPLYNFQFGMRLILIIEEQVINMASNNLYVKVFQCWLRYSEITNF